jgi:hypothetical protein
MKVFVAGANTGALGGQLVSQLVARGHEVVGMTLAASKRICCPAWGQVQSWPTPSTPTRPRRRRRPASPR